MKKQNLINRFDKKIALDLAKAQSFAKELIKLCECEADMLSNPCPSAMALDETERRIIKVIQLRWNFHRRMNKNIRKQHAVESSK